jgi:aminoglycoside phosphotransferase (APT) family kinase protein
VGPVPVPDQRDPGVTRAKLEAWLRERRTDATQVRVTHVQTPSTTGFSAETLLFDAEWCAGGRWQRGSYVAKVAPTGHQIFPEPRFDEQYRLLQILAGTPIKVPAVHWSPTGSTACTRGRTSSSRESPTTCPRTRTGRAAPAVPRRPRGK